MKHMILSLKMKGDVISDHFLMLRFQKILWIQSVLGLLGLLGREGGGPGVLNKTVDFGDIWIPKCIQG